MRFALALAAILGGCGGSSAAEVGHLQYGRLREHADVYRYATYVPSTRRKGLAAPMVVVLHGCSSNPGQMAAASGYDAVAERDRFIVLYPDVDAVDAANARCWKGFWDPRAEGRGRGDASAIAAMTKAVAARWGVDRSRVYAIGISAGGFEASVLGAYYPDLYAAIGIHSGAAFGTGRQGCLAPNQSSADTNRLAGAALSAMGRHVRVMPVIVVHGDRDNVIPYRCGRQALAQWLRTDNLILARDSRPPLPAAPTSVRHARVPHGRTYTVSSYADSSGCVTGQLVAVHGLAHFWSGGPRDPSLGRASGSRGPSATAASWAFFSRWRLNGPRRRC